MVAVLVEALEGVKYECLTNVRRAEGKGGVRFLKRLEASGQEVQS